MSVKLSKSHLNHHSQVRSLFNFQVYIESQATYFRVKLQVIETMTWIDSNLREHRSIKVIPSVKTFDFSVWTRWNLRRIWIWLYLMFRFQNQNQNQSQNLNKLLIPGGEIVTKTIFPRGLITYSDSDSDSEIAVLDIYANQCLFNYIYYISFFLCLFKDNIL